LQYNDSEVPKNKVDFDTVRKIALRLPDVEESTIFRSPALKVHGKLLACIPIHRSAEPDSVAISVDFERRAEMLAIAPDIYYAPRHYVNYPIVLVRLSRIHPDALPDLVSMAWRFVTAKKPHGKRTNRKTGRTT